ncbi:mannonate dehydratase [Pelagovum pacificum]|uniref:Mannonate dehydratase n=1 Tax=Pelagovum pacificum TaxID=2588711 RepID=A0A5C5G977_9RHOB|nr:mannonate dehydratase [Pelagovum pacificum]QQA42192.1 mannonate dehydratase [Pelagovum pacificum]TNY31278.1 mannonate dehydratase [Pelagovum pacificum]
MQQTWRWFGPKDRVSVDHMMQAGVEGVVSALHHLPTGATWSPEEIERRKSEIATRADGTPSTLSWTVVESLPVSENIKKQKGDWKADIAAWKESMTNLAHAGIEVICYNFMPVLDWTRTDLGWERPTGARCMRFDLIDFAAFDIHILARPGAAQSFPDDVVEAAAGRFAEMDDAQKEQLSGNVVFGLPGTAEHFTLDDVRGHLAEYDNISEGQLRGHLIDFLSEVAPLARDLGMRLCCHPDDPPFPLLGLPRIMSTGANYREVLDAVDLPSNGATLCTGSLGARPDNDPVEIFRQLADRVHFLHLRNVAIEGTAVMNSFYEDEHLSGHTDMAGMVRAVVAEEARRKAEGRADWSIPFRPDHGQDILTDIGHQTQPGYPAVGRLKGLAELRGLYRAFEYQRG